MRSGFLRFPLFVILLWSFFSCSKENQVEYQQFYGKWKTSYGDTIEFKKENGKSVLIYNELMNPSLPVAVKREFRYNNNKLAIKLPGYPSTDEYREFQTFAWIQAQQSFTIQGIEWFNFLSSTQTYFTFTRIR
ncbi:MAG TPA: hypothetical protein VF487_20500 [Chitinophagaceae bacterium]